MKLVFVFLVLAACAYQAHSLAEPQYGPGTQVIIEVNNGDYEDEEEGPPPPRQQGGQPGGQQGGQQGGQPCCPDCRGGSRRRTTTPSPRGCVCDGGQPEEGETDTVPRRRQLFKILSKIIASILAR